MKDGKKSLEETIIEGVTFPERKEIVRSSRFGG